MYTCYLPYRRYMAASRSGAAGPGQSAGTDLSGVQSTVTPFGSPMRMRMGCRPLEGVTAPRTRRHRCLMARSARFAAVCAAFAVWARRRRGLGGASSATDRCRAPGAAVVGASATTPARAGARRRRRVGVREARSGDPLDLRRSGRVRCGRQRHHRWHRARSYTTSWGLTSTGASRMSAPRCERPVS